MRKVLIAAIVALVLFATGAFAAAITSVNAKDIASGTGAVAACDTAPKVDFVAGTWQTTPTPADFEILTAKVDAADLCNGAKVQILALDAAGAQVGVASNVGTLDATGNTTVTFTATGSTLATVRPRVMPTVSAAVLLDGVLITP